MELTPNLKSLFSSPDAQPLPLVALLTHLLGKEWVDWLPETIWQGLEDLRIPVSSLNKEKILAARLVATRNRPWEEWEIFIHVCDALNSRVPNFQVLQEPAIGDLMVAVGIMEELSPKIEFSEEVARFTAACVLHHGVWYAPPPIDFAQPFISEPKLRCKECGNTNPDIHPDGLCDACSARYRHDKPFSHRAEVPSGADVSRYLQRDPEPIKARFEQLKSMPVEDLRLVVADHLNPIDVQAIKLLAAHLYLVRMQETKNYQLQGIAQWMR